MAWIESHQELREHPKTKRLARMLGVSVPAVIGHLQCLWWWALDYAQDGDLFGYSNEDIAEAAMWDGEATGFVAALLGCGVGNGKGFLEAHDPGSGFFIHDWFEYAGKLIERRKSDAERKRTQRKPVDRPPDIPQTSAGHPTPVASTVPNRTQPNRTNKNTYVAPVAPSAPVALEEKRTVTATQAVFGALAEVCGYDKSRLTSAERKELNAATKSLVEAKYGPKDVRQMAGNWIPHFDDCTMTPSALAKHATRLLSPPEESPGRKGSRGQAGSPPLEYVN